MLSVAGAESECLTGGCAHSCGQRGTAFQTLGTARMCASGTGIYWTEGDHAVRGQHDKQAAPVRLSLRSKHQFQASVI